jgi:hypothetical protein
VRRLAIADQPCDIGYCDRRLLCQQLRSSADPPFAQVLVKAPLAELRVRALHLPRRARDGACDLGERQPAAVVARDHDARQQVHASARGDRLGLHAC